MFKSAMERLGKEEKGKEAPEMMGDKHGVAKTVTVSKHNDGHHSVEDPMGQTTHFNMGDEEGMGPHILAVLEQPDADDRAEAETETAQKGTSKKGSKVEK